MLSNSTHMHYPPILIWLIDLVFPYRCVACHKYLNRAYLCRTCFRKISIRKQSECIGCKRATKGATCPFCKDQNSLDKLLIVSDFKESVVQSLIKRLKYSFVFELAYPLNELTKKYLKLRSSRGDSFIVGNPLLVPVPLHTRRENWRGFNQAKLLADMLARNYHLETHSALVRVSQRMVQAEINDKDARFKNVQGVYKCLNKDSVLGRDVLLIDDVCTTGATLNECARILKAAGAVSVAALVIARG